MSAAKMYTTPGDFARRCRNGSTCSTAECAFAHSPKHQTGKPQSRHCVYAATCPGMKCRTCDTVHTPAKPCRHGAGCWSAKCTFTHPRERKTPCRNGNHCIYGNTTSLQCRYLHPPWCEFDKNCLLGSKCNKRHRLPKAGDKQAAGTAVSSPQKASPQKGVACPSCDPKSHHCCPIHQ